MKLKSIITLIEQVYPLSTQEDFDCSGLLYDSNKDIKTVLICLDITKQVVDYALNKNFDLIITHHPLIFRNYNTTFIYQRMIYHQLVAHKISLYSIHTNYDNSLNGMNPYVLKLLNKELINKDDFQGYALFNVDHNIINQLKEVFNTPITIYNQNN
ncbi:MAG: Nif3-like dinuclear metal center hexameric protein, partial [Bacilli bacterium]